jgi:hypothetical protein
MDFVHVARERFAKRLYKRFMQDDDAQIGEILSDEETELIITAALAGAAQLGRSGTTTDELVKIVERCAQIYVQWIYVKAVYAGLFFLGYDHANEELVFLPNPDKPLDASQNALADEIERLLQQKEWGDDDPPHSLEN